MAEYIEREAVLRDWPMCDEPADAYQFIRGFPAADVRPVVRGEWLQDCDYHFRCSICGDRWTVSNGNPLDISNGWNYCPNCGAQMIRGDDNEI